MDGYTSSNTVALVACSKSKLDHAAPASELYTGQLFRAARRYVEALGVRWYILSAKHGLVAPTTILDPYNCSLSTLADDQRRAWRYQVYRQALQLGLDDASIHWMILAGRDYRQRLLPLLQGTVVTPLLGYRYAQQIKQLERWLQDLEEGSA